MTKFQIDISQNLIDFKHKLELEPRVILSAGFGDGKTYFLSRFKEMYTDDYHFFTIYPSQYVIGTNESIFEYIKRDILFQLVDQELVTEELDLPGLLKEMMESVDITEVLSFFLSKPLAKALGKLVDGLKRLRAGIDNNTVSASKYLDSFTSVKGGLYENDAFTCLIRKCFDHIRAGDGKEIVLIIEDLDRIAPANIFSILNIFGAHFDRHYIVGETDEENKFGFDRLITVMDYANIKLLYNSMYGDEGGHSSFEGYIAKYICSKPFFYSIRKEGRRLLTEKLYDLFEFTEPNDIVMKHEIEEEIKKLSIRDIERIYLFEPERIIRNPEYPVVINGYQLSPKSSLVRLQAYKFFFGLGLDLSESSSRDPELITQLETNGPTWILHNIPQYETINGVQYGHTRFVLKIEKDEKGWILAFRFKKTSRIAPPCPEVDYLQDETSSVRFNQWETENKFRPFFYYSASSSKDNYELPEES